MQMLWLILHISMVDYRLLSALQDSLTSLGARPSASQLAICIVTSLLYKPCTRHGKKLTVTILSWLFRAIAVRNSCTQFHIFVNEKMKVTTDEDDLSDGLSIAAIASELHVEAVTMLCGHAQD